MPSNYISVIPNSIGGSPGSTKNIHLATLSLHLNLTEQTPNYSMFEMYVFNTIIILYAIWVLLRLILDFNLVNMTDFTLSRLMYFTLI